MLVISALLAPITAPASILSTDTLESFGASTDVFSEFRIRFGYASPIPHTGFRGFREQWVLVYPIFDVTVSASDKGKTFRANSGNGFKKAVELLTNGVDTDHVTEEIYHPDFAWASGGREWNTIPNASSVDFSEWKITRFELTIDEVTIDSPGSNVNRDGNWTDYSYNATFRVIGYRPSTSSLAPVLNLLLGP